MLEIDIHFSLLKPRTNENIILWYGNYGKYYSGNKITEQKCVFDDISKIRIKKPIAIPTLIIITTASSTGAKRGKVKNSPFIKTWKFITYL